MTKRHPRQRHRRPRAPGHDSGYKLPYSHVAIVRDLLRHVVPGDWIDQLDLGSLEKCSGSYVSDDLRDRSDDLIWRVRWGPDWLYLYLLLEFQSTIDAWMAVRIQTYVGLLYQDLILQAPEQTSLRRAFAVWISRVFLPRRLPGVAIDSMNDLHEVRGMLAERYETWTEQWKREGLDEGRDE
ncbi:Rpn family recombination-promoting nuclease/putative transposase [Lamprocystis purpurea]|jgi:predicted transposase YdaD|uniref:Rpn family recombination-promoting nuclease/putative transposase n=1 Tax=Lamprocystis purpurea TaxID=61598 RepID=UPI000361BFB8|nr:Rpn family recombination-promoting nuclease/putative transposase [Lamprocystis purpurea]